MQHGEGAEEQWLRAREDPGGSAGAQSQGGGWIGSESYQDAATREQACTSWDSLLEAVSFGRKGEETAKDMSLPWEEGRMSTVATGCSQDSDNIWAASLFSPQCSLRCFQLL